MTSIFAVMLVQPNIIEIVVARIYMRIWMIAQVSFVRFAVVYSALIRMPIEAVKDNPCIAQAPVDRKHTGYEKNSNRQPMPGINQMSRSLTDVNLPKNSAYTTNATNMKLLQPHIKMAMCIRISL
jgi:hypothetical protein